MDCNRVWEATMSALISSFECGDLKQSLEPGYGGHVSREHGFRLGKHFGWVGHHIGLDKEQILEPGL
ncbi:uncharacterized [Tachysurus ichikawai]